MTGADRSTYTAEADRLIAEFGVDSIEYLLAKIRDAVLQNDDQTVGSLDAQLRHVEARLAR
jgi:hypothetical protein